MSNMKSDEISISFMSDESMHIEVIYTLDIPTYYSIRKDNCIGYGNTPQKAFENLHDKIIKLTLSKNEK